MPVGDVFYSGQPSEEEDEYVDPFYVMADICTLRAGALYADNRIKEAAEDIECNSKIEKQRTGGTDKMVSEEEVKELSEKWEVYRSRKALRIKEETAYKKQLFEVIQNKLLDIKVHYSKLLECVQDISFRVKSTEFDMSICAGFNYRYSRKGCAGPIQYPFIVFITVNDDIMVFEWQEGASVLVGQDKANARILEKEKQVFPEMAQMCDTLDRDIYTELQDALQQPSIDDSQQPVG